MKCPECRVNHKYRAGMRCRCGYDFALDPKSDACTDGKFLAVVNSASSNDTYFFTTNQLYTAFCRKQVRNPWPRFLVGFAFIGFGLAAAHSAEQVAPLVIFGVIGLAFVFSAMNMPLVGSVSRSDLERLLNKYQAKKGPLEKLLVEPTLHKPPPDWPEPDIYEYGVERIVVVQHDLLVDLLVKNDLHSAQRALVISGAGYPDYLIPQAVKALEQNPDLPVYFLHDATTVGQNWFDVISNSDKLPWRDHPLIDMGLYPEDMRRIKRLRPLKPETEDFALAADVLPMAMLSLGIAVALDEQLSLGELLADERERDAGASSSFG